MYYNKQSLDDYFEKFKEFVERKSQKPFDDFNNSYIEREEGYKDEVYKKAIERLRLKDKLIWKEGDIGDGKILKQIISAIEIKGNNLIQWDNRFGEDRKQHKIFLNLSKEDAKKFEDVFFNFYKNITSPEIAFNKLLKFTSDYRLISYLFFIKKTGSDSDIIRDRYLPIVPTKFDKIFEKIGVENYSAKGNCSFENYKEYHLIIKEVREYLIDRINKSISLLDAHSFLWIIGNQLEKYEEEVMPSQSVNLIAEILHLTPNYTSEIKPVLLSPVSQESTILSNSYKVITQEEYLKMYNRQLLIGKTSEEIVMKVEKEYFESINRYDLAKSVELVSDKPLLGYDILSWEVNDDGSGEKEKQIEVKTVRTTNGKTSFFLAAHELKKSLTLSNYHIYCVQYDSDNNESDISFLKNPNLNDSSLFSMKPTHYKVTFKNVH